MAIAFTRVEFVKRSEGRNACQKSAYIGRERISFYGNVVAPPQIYDWSHKGKSAYHEILLPEGVDSRYRNSEILWNATEAVENRKNSQTALDIVIALPDDASISLEDRIELARSFVKEHFVDHGLGAQLDIHPPEKQLELENGETVLADYNWHAHVLVTTRRFTKDGLALGEKARDLMPKISIVEKAQGLIPKISKVRVVSGTHWGKLWAEHQNCFFESKGMNLRVDPTGVVAQIHLGPVRMQGRAYSLFEEQELNRELNAEESKDPAKILNKITETSSTFTSEDLDRFLGKFVPLQEIDGVREAFWKQKSIISLLDPISIKESGRFTSTKVWEEERRILRIGKRLVDRSMWDLSEKELESASQGLNKEQKETLSGVVAGGGLTCIDGHAGTGKSRVLLAIRNGYAQKRFTVRAFGADNATTQELLNRGFEKTEGTEKAENIYRFLFAVHHGRREIRRGCEVWLLDEAGKIGSQPLLELLRLAHKARAKVVLAGSQAQMSSVARGNMFSELCNRFGAHSLKSIQRQSDFSHREMAKNLATGEVGHAIDKLAELGGLRWAESKQKAMEELIGQWVTDRALFPKQPSLIIAHSNREMRVLNEVIHTFLRDRKELGKQEFECQTTQGKCWVSTGDLIEFRRNDKELEVTNGMAGILIEASSEKFVVGVRNSSGTRKVSFDPRDYNGFQLGYATTYYRSQGRTVDRAYVLHSKSMDRPMFYVGLTRHVRDAKCFISREDVPSLAALKSQFYREPVRDTTLSFTSARELESLQREKERMDSLQEHLQSLAASDSGLDRAKGFSLTLFENVREKSAGWLEAFRDRLPDRSFYSSSRKLPKQPGVVFETKPELDKKELTPLSQDRIRQIAAEAEKSYSKNSQGLSPRRVAWHSLTDKQQVLLKGYFDASDQAASLHTLAQEGQNQKSELSLRQACVERNEAAFAVREALDDKTLLKVLSKKSYEIVQDRANRHQQRIEAAANSSVQIQERLAEHIEPLIYRLFPDGPSWKDHSTFRFGAKGSLAVRHSGSKAGSFYDFENELGGGLIQLIQREKGLAHQEALKWAREFLGSDISTIVPAYCRIPRSSEAREKEWVSMRPDPSVPAPSLKELSSKLNGQFKETARYAYKDVDGSPLFYVLRLEDREEPSKKEVLPLSYGRWSDGDGHERWALKGYAAEHRPLFNLDRVVAQPKAVVLVVEGEKTAEAASQLAYPRETVCVTWCGGASAVSKTDWSPLSGREVLIWPDNDQAGFKAADQLCGELRQIGAKFVKQVDAHLLQKHLPEKWDLADPLPNELPKNFVKDALLKAQPKSVDFDLFAAFYKGRSDEFSTLWLREILVSVEKRLRSELEQKHPNRAWEVQDAILKEASQIVSGRDELLKTLNFTIGGSKELLERIALQATVHTAKHGIALTPDQLLRIKERIQNDGVAERYVSSSLVASDLAMSQKEMSLAVKRSTLVNEAKILLESQPNPGPSLLEASRVPGYGLER